MSDAAERRRRRQVEWSSKIFRGPHTAEAMEVDALAESPDFLDCLPR